MAPVEISPLSRGLPASRFGHDPDVPDDGRLVAATI
jgi:hypothetical protein